MQPNKLSNCSSSHHTEKHCDSRVEEFMVNVTYTHTHTESLINKVDDLVAKVGRWDHENLQVKKMYLKTVGCSWQQNPHCCLKVGWVRFSPPLFYFLFLSVWPLHDCWWRRRRVSRSKIQLSCLPAYDTQTPDKLSLFSFPLTASHYILFFNCSTSPANDSYHTWSWCCYWLLLGVAGILRGTLAFAMGEIVDVASHFAWS